MPAAKQSKASLSPEQRKKPAKTAARATRSERIDLRVNAETKALLARAYELAGYSNLTSFIIATAREHAQRVIEEHNQFMLTNRDRDRFLAALANPPEPNAALRAAAEKYGAEKGQD